MSIIDVDVDVDIGDDCLQGKSRRKKYLTAERSDPLDHHLQESLAQQQQQQYTPSNNLPDDESFHSFQPRSKYHASESESSGNALAILVIVFSICFAILFILLLLLTKKKTPGKLLRSHNNDQLHNVNTGLLNAQVAIPSLLDF